VSDHGLVALRDDRREELGGWQPTRRISRPDLRIPVAFVDVPQRRGAGVEVRLASRSNDHVHPTILSR
jgi:hypothetical protein